MADIVWFLGLVTLVSFCITTALAVVVALIRFWPIRVTLLTAGQADLLKDPQAVHINMLRGDIAKLIPEQIGHLYRGEEAKAVIAELLRQNPEAAAALRQSPTVEEVARVIAPDAFDVGVPTGPRRVIHRNAMKAAREIDKLYRRGGE